MINEKAIKAYVLKEFRGIVNVEIRKLGSGVQGSGFLVQMQTTEGFRSYVVKSLLSEGFGHDYPSDRAAVFLQDLDEYAKLPNHVKAMDVLAEMEDGTVKSIGGGKEYYLIMEKVEGRDYFNDLSDFAGKEQLEERDISKIRAMASYLVGIHAMKKESKTLYWRKLRDTVGHGECLMGVFDMYPDGTLPYEEMADIVKKSVDWTYKLKPGHKRLSQIHGDFHPGNIWFKEAESREQNAMSHEPRAMNEDPEFILLDRSRGPWGEPADDLTAMTINYIFFSIKNHGDVRGSYLAGLKLFFNEYIRLSGDQKIVDVTAPFFAFRCAVVANPVFYPDLSAEARKKIFNFARGVLSAERFEVEKVNEYLAG
jgi:hypothetical protein